MNIEDYVKAGKIASEVREMVRVKDWVGKTVYEICEEVENEMINLLENTEKLIEMCTLPIFEKFPEKYLPETIATKIMDQLERK